LATLKSAATSPFFSLVLHSAPLGIALTAYY
jgi:hypothetical protein